MLQIGGEHPEHCGTWVGGEFYSRHLLKPPASYVTARSVRRSVTYTDVQGSQDEHTEHGTRHRSSNVCCVRKNIPALKDVDRDAAVLQQRWSRRFVKSVDLKRLFLLPISDFNWLNKVTRTTHFTESVRLKCGGICMTEMLWLQVMFFYFIPFY